MPSTPFADLAHADLVIDAVFEGGTVGTFADDPLARLLPVGNQGGFRYRGSPPSPELVVLLSTGRQPAWPDELDEYTGIYTYYGDNRTPGHELHDTQRRGNSILVDAFNRTHADKADRRQAPVFLVFHSTGVRRDIRFLGLAVPGGQALTSDDDLVAVWRAQGGQRFQNYLAKFTILSVPMISRAWLNEVLAGNPTGPAAPEPYRRWVDTRHYDSLIARRIGHTRSRLEQLPETKAQERIVDAIYGFCSPNPVNFERIAASLWELQATGRVETNMTRPSRDGGRDAIGTYFLGPADDQIGLSFSLEAKCYAPTNGVGVRDISRLISRIRHREFGVFVTTSYVAQQAYSEIRDDGHPIVILTGRDIAVLLQNIGIDTATAATQWVQGVLDRPAKPYSTQS